MKKVIITSLLLIVWSTFNSCEKFLDINPSTSLASSLALDNLVGIEAAINGAYTHLHSDWVERQWIFSACLSSAAKEVNPLSNSNYQDALNHQAYTDMVGSGNYLWKLSFRALHLANQVIQAIPDIAETDALVIKEKERLLGEAHYLRGLIYFVLNRFWGQPQNGLSVPILLAPITVVDKPARNTIEEVKALVIADLKRAETLMTEVTQNKNRATIWVVKAMLARVYLEYEQYEQARDIADDVISNGSFALINTDVRLGYKKTLSSENVFSFLSASNDLAALNLYQRYTITANNLAQLGPSNDMWDFVSSDPTDQRFRRLFIENAGRRACRKFDERLMHLPYLRLPELYLIRAEARARTGNLEGALEDLNLLRQRAKVADQSYADQQDLLNKIYDERKLELSFEGDLLHLNKRWKKPVGGYPHEEAIYKLVFFIPQNEVNSNQNMIQNDIW
jgi:hypothetical protein